jgi:hypothetical protein
VASRVIAFPHPRERGAPEDKLAVAVAVAVADADAGDGEVG